jgi:hypothetical protein
MLYPAELRARMRQVAGHSGIGFEMQEALHFFFTLSLLSTLSIMHTLQHARARLVAKEEAIRRRLTNTLELAYRRRFKFNPDNLKEFML